MSYQFLGPRMRSRCSSMCLGARGCEDSAIKRWARRFLIGFKTSKSPRARDHPNDGHSNPNALNTSVEQLVQLEEADLRLCKSVVDMRHRASTSFQSFNLQAGVMSIVFGGMTYLNKPQISCSAVNGFTISVFLLFLVLLSVSAYGMYVSIHDLTPLIHNYERQRKQNAKRAVSILREESQQSVDLEAAPNANGGVFHPDISHRELVERCDFIRHSRVGLSMKKTYICLGGCIMALHTLYGVMISYFVYHTHDGNTQCLSRWWHFGK